MITLKHPDNRNLKAIPIKNVMRVGMWVDNGRMWVVPNYFVVIQNMEQPK